MKRKITALLVALGIALTIGGAVTAPPAAAAWGQTFYRDCYAPGQWHFVATQNIMHNDNGTITAYQVWIGYEKPGWKGLEYRWRVITGAGTVLFDTGYQTQQDGTWYNAGQYGFYPVPGTRIHMDAGRLGDGQPTCGMDIYLA